MTDRELLELAAKAVGLAKGKAQDSQWFYCELGQCGEGFYLVDGNLLSYWNPLTDDGDALRLAVRLGITVGPEGPYVVGKSLCRASWSNRMCSLGEYGDGDTFAATRRAIVRAAAEIGKQK